MRNGIEFAKVWAVFSDSPAPAHDECPVSAELKPELKELGVRYELKKAWICLLAKNGKGLVIARQKRVRQVDIRGFGKGWEGTLPLRGTNGAIEAHVDLDDPNALSHMHMLLVAGSSLKDEEAEQRKVQARKKRDEALKPEKVDAKASPISKLDKAASTERLLRLFEVSKRMGKKLAPETVERLIAQGASLPDGIEAWIENDAQKPVIADTTTVEQGEDAAQA